MINFKWDMRFLDLAKEMARWSKDPSTRIGAVVVDPVTRRILSTGYNGFPRGIEDTEERLNDREQKYGLIVHAEMNAIYNATLSGVSLNNSHLFVTGLPSCSDCAKGIIQVGIKEVICLIPDDLTGETWSKWENHWNKSKAMYDEAGVTYTLYQEWDIPPIVKVKENTRL